MAFEIPKLNYTGAIREIKLGRSGDVAVGGETAYPFYLFEGEMPNQPKIAMEVYDAPPEEDDDISFAPFKDVVGDPVAWAKMNVEKFGADMIALQLISADPNGLNRDGDQAAATAKAVAQAVDVPVIVYGTGDKDKDIEVLRKVAEECEGLNLIIGPTLEGNHKQIAAPCIGYRHTVAATSPIDINLAKQLNILLGNLGVREDGIIIDPTTGGLGYGIEYTYSIMERIRMAALAQQDDQLKYPILCDLGKEVWKSKEARMGGDDARYGDPAKRGIVMEAVTAVLMLISGADILVMRHPEAVALVKKFLKEFSGK
ncbi:MAG: acetyl-CoA decarbonylase/synthase complex subunit delta [bacterium]